MRTCARGLVGAVGAAVIAFAPPARAAEPPVRFDGHKVVRVEISSLRDARTMTALSDDPWTCGWDGLSPGAVDFRIAPDRLAALDASGLCYRVLIDDVQHLIDAERRSPVQPTGISLRGDAWYAAYQPAANVSARIDELVQARPDLASRFTAGQSLEQRPISGIRINSNTAAAKPAIIINLLQHAREWITVMAGMYLADRLVNTYDNDPRTHRLVDAFDWYIIPITNPDGYEFTWASNRLWRKNRRPNPDGSFGVDTNRNWGSGWGGEGASATPSSDTFRGTEAFSEPETRVLRDFILAHPTTLFHLDVHSYGQLILEPYGYSPSLPADTRSFNALSLTMQEAMYAAAGATYNPGPIYRNIYPASGGACDWAYDAGPGHPLSMSFELRDEGQTGFVLPAEQILPAARETLEGVLAAADRLLARPVDVEFVDGQPPRISAGANTTVRIRTLRGSATPDPASSVILRQRLGRTGPFSSAAMSAAGSDEAGPVLAGILAAGVCGSVTQYYFEIRTLDGRTLTAPPAGAAGPYEAVAQSATTVLATTLDSAPAAAGWLTSDPSDTATAGRWTQGDPSGTVAQAEYDHTPLAGAQCFYTGFNPTGNAGSGDVDNGKTTLFSPVLNLSGFAEAEASFWIWYSNNRSGAGTADDEFAVDVTGNAGAAGPAWVRALTLRAQAPISQSTAVWRKYTVRLGALVPLSTQVRFRFIAADLGTAGFVEAAVDDVEVVGFTCARPACAGDFNGDGAVSVQDIFDFLQAFFANNADVDGSGATSVEDLFIFLGRWFAGC